MRNFESDHLLISPSAAVIKNGKDAVEKAKEACDKLTEAQKKLKVGKVYYIQVRPYTKVTNQATGQSRNIYGKWSNKKKVKIRK